MAKRSLNLTIRIDQETLDILDALRGRKRLRASRAEYIRMLIRYAKLASEKEGGRFIVRVPREEWESF
jgi:Arc/MetJ-type ribon-helix-helix transcriptional regulator